MLRPIDLGNPVNRGASLNLGLAHWYRGLPNNRGTRTIFDLCKAANFSITDGTGYPAAMWSPKHGRCDFSPGGGVSPAYVATSDSSLADFSSTGITVSGWVFPVDVGTYNVVAGGTSTNFFYVGHYQYGLTMYPGSGYSVTQAVGPNLVQYAPTFAVWSVSASVGKVYADGVEVGSVSQTITPPGPLTWLLGNSGFGYGTNGGFGSLRFYQRILTNSEIVALYEEELAGCPTTLNRYTPRTMVFLGGAAAAPVSATPGVASLATTRYAPAVSTPRTATPGVKSLATTKYAPTVSTPRLATIGKLSLTTTSLAPGVSLGVRSTPGVASLTATAYAPTISTPRLSTPGAKSLALTPLTPVVSTPRTVTVGVASLSTTVYAPVIATPRTSTPSVASLSLVGFAPTVATPRTSTPGTASLSAAGFAPTVLVPRVTTPDVAALSLTSFAPVAATPRAAVPGTAGVAITTYPPVAQTPSTAAPATAALTATAFPPAVATPRTSVPGVAVLAATAFAPIVAAINPITATPSTRALSLTTYSPVASLGVIVLPGGKFRRPVASLARSFSRDALGRIFRRAAESRAFSRDGLGRKFHRSSLSRTWSYAMSANSIPVQTLTKAVGDDRYYLCDLTKAPEIVAGATIASAEILGGSGLTIGSPSVLGTLTDGIAAGKGVKVQISGGTDDAIVSLACKATLSTGSVIVVPVKIAVAANYE